MIFFRLDEGISYKICNAAEQIGIPPELAFEAPFLAGLTGETDLHWIERLSQRGKPSDARCVLSADRLSEPERAAAEQAGLIVFLVPGPRWWRELKHMSQAAYFLRWLPAMIEMATTLPPGSLIQLPKRWTPHLRLRPQTSVLGAARRGRPRRPREGRAHQDPRLI